VVCGQVIVEEPPNVVDPISTAPVELERSVEYEASRLSVVSVLEPITLEVSEINDKSDVYSGWGCGLHFPASATKKLDAVNTAASTFEVTISASVFKTRRHLLYCT